MRLFKVSEIICALKSVLRDGVIKLKLKKLVSKWNFFYVNYKKIDKFYENEVAVFLKALDWKCLLWKFQILLSFYDFLKFYPKNTT